MASGRTKGSKSHKWTSEEIAAIRSNGHLGIDHLCKMLNLRKMQIIMKAHKERISIVKDLPTPIRPICRECNSNMVAMKGRSRRHSGRPIYSSLCHQCRKYEYKRHKKHKCEKCGFIPEWLGQLDVDHIDGNRFNDDPSNLMTLCANCHRLKTHLNKDYNRYRLADNG